MFLQIQNVSTRPIVNQLFMVNSYYPSSEKESLVLLNFSVFCSIWKFTESFMNPFILCNFLYYYFSSFINNLIGKSLDQCYRYVKFVPENIINTKHFLHNFEFSKQKLKSFPVSRHVWT